ncbi:MAG: hypothetical protein HY235_16535 [Acidobacteria bacterium]|nr:hypothetical protein [Acidobacteriota bacterium]
MTRSLAIPAILLAAAWLATAADITGTWSFEVQMDAGAGTPVFEFKQSGEKLTGKYQGQLGEAPLEGTVSGNNIKFIFKLSLGDEPVEVTYEGVIEGADSMKGKATYGSFASGTWTARRKK